MSRIDEALKRAAGGTPDLQEVEVRRGGPAHAPEGLLEHYPEERPARATRRAERAAAAIVPAPAVPRPTPILHQRGFDPSVAGKLVAVDGAPSVSVEQYRRLAGSIHELQVESGLKTLMVTSALPREGKTLTIANLALTLSESYGRRVLLIDADLRRPSIHQVFKLPNVTGLGDVLRSDRRDLPLFAVSPLLSLLPAGQPDTNPTAGLTSDRMRALLEESAGAYDWVLVDAPPVTLLPDAHLLARLTRAVLFVIGAGSTPYPLVDRAIAEVGRESIVGTVLNRIADQHIPATGYYHDYHIEAGSPA